MIQHNPSGATSQLGVLYRREKTDTNGKGNEHFWRIAGIDQVETPRESIVFTHTCIDRTTVKQNGQTACVSHQLFPSELQ